MRRARYLADTESRHANNGQELRQVLLGATADVATVVGLMHGQHVAGGNGHQQVDDAINAAVAMIRSWDPNATDAQARALLKEDVVAAWAVYLALADGEPMDRNVVDAVGGAVVQLINVPGGTLIPAGLRPTVSAPNGYTCR